MDNPIMIKPRGPSGGRRLAAPFPASLPDEKRRAAVMGDGHPAPAPAAPTGASKRRMPWSSRGITSAGRKSWSPVSSGWPSGGYECGFPAGLVDEGRPSPRPVRRELKEEPASMWCGSLKRAAGVLDRRNDRRIRGDGLVSSATESLPRKPTKRRSFIRRALCLTGGSRTPVQRCVASSSTPRPGWSSIISPKRGDCSRPACASGRRGRPACRRGRFAAIESLPAPAAGQRLALARPFKS